VSSKSTSLLGPSLDDEIGRRLEEASRSGELRSARSYGKPLEPDAGWGATPPALRMPMKILKDAGFAPPEVFLLRERARLRAARDAASDEAQREQLVRELADVEQKLALRLESLRLHGL
jgi:hypothetical protein